MSRRRDRARHRGPQPDRRRRRRSRRGPLGARPAAGAGRGADRAPGARARRQPARRARSALRVRHARARARRATRGASCCAPAAPELGGDGRRVGSGAALRRGSRDRPRLRSARRGDEPIDAAARRRGDRRAERQRPRACSVAAMEALGAMRYERAVQALDRAVPVLRPAATLAEAALDALARIAHPASAPLFVAAARRRRRGADAASPSRGSRGVGDRSRSSAAIQTARRHASATTPCSLAGDFAAVDARRTRRSTDRRGAHASRGCAISAMDYLVELAPGARADARRGYVAGSRRADRAPTSPTSWAWPAIRRRCRSSSRCCEGSRIARRRAGGGAGGGRLRAGRAVRRMVREAAARVLRSPDARRRRAICSARCSCTIAAASARAASSSRSRRTSASPIPPVTPRPARRKRNAAALRRARPRLRLSELRHPLPGQRRDRGARIAGGGAHPRARCRSTAWTSCAVGARAPRRAVDRGRLTSRSRSLPRPRQPDDGDGDHARREPGGSARATGCSSRIAASGSGAIRGVRGSASASGRSARGARTSRGIRPSPASVRSRQV